VSGPTFTFSIAGSPATPATGTITALGARSTVPGVVYLDGYFCVMDIYGVIYISALNDARAWNALDFITADAEPGQGVVIARALNYVVAFKEWSTEFFFNAGNPTGSPLSRVDNGFTLVGCASGTSLAYVSEGLAWISQTRQDGRGVHLMQGTQQAKISTPDVDRVLDNDSLAEVYSYGLKVGGHSLYILTLITTGVTLVFDFTSKVWTQWASGAAEAYFNLTHATYNGGLTLGLHKTSGNVYSLDESYLDDAGTSIDLLCRTIQVDNGTTNNHAMGKVEVIGTKASTTATVRWSDDDYATWSTNRTVDLSLPRSSLRRCGDFRRRAFELRHSGSVAVVLSSLEIEGI
jgi:hypothetical protein